MDRWNELIAGYVLENLTTDEAQELSDVLREHPQLQLEISKLRKTATMSGSQRAERSTDDLYVGAEGWTDTVTHLSDSPPPQPALSDEEPPTGISSRHWLAVSESVFQRTSLLSWILLLLLLGAAVDNWRVRVQLTAAQEQILQMKRSAEY